LATSLGWEQSHGQHHTPRRFRAAVSCAGQCRCSIGAGLAKAALAGKVDGRLVDTSFLIERDAALAIVTDKDADGLDIIRHSTAHLLAYAVKELFPDAQVTIGPVIDNGFYYDFSYKRPFTPEDLEAIEARMARLAKRDDSGHARGLARDEAVAFFKSHRRALQGRDHRLDPAGPGCRCIARAISSTCAAARTCRPPASSRSSSS
jgi:hypothetical protein